MDDRDTSQNRDGQDGLRDASRGQRLQRVMADAGIASRRACEQLIEGGHVTVNGTVVRTLPAWVDPQRDRVLVDGQPLARPEPHLYLMFNKPARTLATGREGPDDARRSVHDMVEHPLSTRLFPAGRLDFEATGLLLLTNDGDLANRLTHARYGVEKVYQMVVRGTLDDASLERVNKVIGQVTKRAAKEAGAPHPARADLTILAREEGRTVLELVTRDGRATLVRDTLAALGHPVKKMERVAIGPVRLRGVAVGQWRELTREELSELRRAASGKPPRSTEVAPASVVPASRRRRRVASPVERPTITKRFRGIGKPLDSEGKTSKATARPRAAPRGPSRAGPPADPVSGERVVDRRRGRGEGVNAKRRKPPSAGPGSVRAPKPSAGGNRPFDGEGRTPPRPSGVRPGRGSAPDSLSSGPSRSGPSRGGVAGDRGPKGPSAPRRGPSQGSGGRAPGKTGRRGPAR